MGVVAWLAYDAMLPKDVIAVVVALVSGTAAFGAIGLLLAWRSGAVARRKASAPCCSSRRGSSPARPAARRPAFRPPRPRRCAALAHLVTAVQDPWFGFGWNVTDLAVLAIYAVAAGGPALWFLRWG